MRFTVTVLNDALYKLPRRHQVKLARRAARKALRMGSTSATVHFPGPQGLQVVVNCQQATIVISQAHESTRSVMTRNYRKSA